jgi:Fuc2NAc and GlcNAc transferase
MPSNIEWLLLIGTVLASAVGTGLWRQHALARQLLDIPNARSSHSRPTPLGGGLAIVVVFLAIVVGLLSRGVLDRSVSAALLGAGLAVATVGFVDDRKHVAARWRLLLHFVAAMWALHWLGGAPPFLVFGQMISLGWAGNALALVALVWLLNLYNFMDGIDGIAGVEACTVCVGAALVGTARASAGGQDTLSMILGAACLGFLFWNFPPARIFLGDVGSGFLGITLGIIALAAAHTDPTRFWTWMILLGVFVVDATVTLVRRAAAGARVFDAHRSHAYQHAAFRTGSHARISLAVGAINLCWLLPVALLVATGRVDGVIGCTLAYLPLTWLAVRLGAGKVHT